MIESITINAFGNSNIEVVTTREGKGEIVKAVLEKYNILGIITDASNLNDQSLITGDSLVLSTPTIINDSLTGLKVNASSIWEKDGTDLNYSIDSVTRADAGIYQGTVNVTYSDGTEIGSFSTNEVTVDIAGKLTFTNVSENLYFEEIRISDTATISKRSSGWGITVEDSRGTDSTWRVDATLTKEFTNDAGHTLTNSLMYVDEDGNEKVMELGSPITVLAI